MRSVDANGSVAPAGRAGRGVSVCLWAVGHQVASRLGVGGVGQPVGQVGTGDGYEYGYERVAPAATVLGRQLAVPLMT